ncbi:MAG TPA: hypothetical protein VMN57_11115 [Anaerolineales bacterium]|nr:hypothetical protein [Anaerolineales bacterium]
MYLERVKNDSVWGSLKYLFTGSLLIFLINIYFGFDNALTSPAAEIPRWQILIHLHGGSIGWITLSAVGIAIWTLTGDRMVDAAYENKVRSLTRAAVWIFGLYVLGFGISFANPNNALVYYLPIFGVGAVLTLWVSAFWAFGQFKNQAPLTTVHWLIAGALLTASIGATVGMLLGLERAIGQFLPNLPQGPDRVGAHAGMMDTYLFLVAAAIVEWATRKEAKKWGWGGLLQALFWMVGATIVPIAFFLGIVEQVLPIFGLLLIIGMVIFLVRFGWRAIANFSGGPGVRSWAFFGTIWLVVYMGLFLYAVVGTGGDFSVLPTWFFAFFAHAGFVGMMTNLLMAVVGSRAQAGAGVLPWGETAALWIINLGILVFLGLKVSADLRIGAAVMGIGVLLGVFTMFQRLRAS